MDNLILEMDTYDEKRGGASDGRSAAELRNEKKCKQFSNLYFASDG